MWKSLKYAGAASVWNKDGFIKPSKAKLSGAGAPGPRGRGSWQAASHQSNREQVTPTGGAVISDLWRQTRPTWKGLLFRSSSCGGFRGINVFVIQNKLHVHLSAPAGGCSRQDTEGHVISTNTAEETLSISSSISTNARLHKAERMTHHLAAQAWGCAGAATFTAGARRRKSRTDSPPV